MRSQFDHLASIRLGASEVADGTWATSRPIPKVLILCKETAS